MYLIHKDFIRRNWPWKHSFPFAPLVVASLEFFAEGLACPVLSPRSPDRRLWRDYVSSINHFPARPPVFFPLTFTERGREGEGGGREGEEGKKEGGGREGEGGEREGGGGREREGRGGG